MTDTLHVKPSLAEIQPKKELYTPERMVVGFVHRLVSNIMML